MPQDRVWLLQLALQDLARAPRWYWHEWALAACPAGPLCIVWWDSGSSVHAWTLPHPAPPRLQALLRIEGLGLDGLPRALLSPSLSFPSFPLPPLSCLPWGLVLALRIPLSSQACVFLGGELEPLLGGGGWGGEQTLGEGQRLGVELKAAVQGPQWPLSATPRDRKQEP